MRVFRIVKRNLCDKNSTVIVAKIHLSKFRKADYVNLYKSLKGVPPDTRGGGDNENSHDDRRWLVAVKWLHGYGTGQCRSGERSGLCYEKVHRAKSAG
jgi:hypothetical protein